MTLDRRVLPLVEASSVLLTLSLVVGFRRVFDNDSFVGTLMVVVLVTRPQGLLGNQVSGGH